MSRKVCAECGERSLGKPDPDTGAWYCNICWDLYDEDQEVDFAQSFIFCTLCKKNLHEDHFFARQRSVSDPKCMDCIKKQKQKSQQESRETFAKNYEPKKYKDAKFSVDKYCMVYTTEGLYWICRLCNTKSKIYDGIIRHLCGNRHLDESRCLELEVQNIWKCEGDLRALYEEEFFTHLMELAFQLDPKMIQKIDFQFDPNLIDWLQDGFPCVVVNILLDYVGVASKVRIHFHDADFVAKHNNDYTHLGYLWLDKSERTNLYEEVPVPNYYSKFIYKG